MIAALPIAGVDSDLAIPCALLHDTLEDTVTTPAGCTIDGILELEDGGLRVTLIKAVVKATERAKELLET